MTVKEFCKVLTEELDSEYWGDIDPFWFRAIGEGKEGSPDADEDGNAKALKEVLERVFKKLGWAI